MTSSEPDNRPDSQAEPPKPSDPRGDPRGDPKGGPRGDPRGESGHSPPRPPRERMFNAPVASLLVAAAILASYWFQSRSADEMALIYSYGFRPADLDRGVYGGLFTHALLHGNWLHAGMNAVGALAFGAPVARLMTRPPAGIAGFFILFVLGAAFAALSYGLLHPGSEIPLVGASGGVFALIGASTRLLGRSWPAPLLSRQVISSLMVWTGLNLAIGFLGYAPGAEGARVAWEAHIAGLAFGALMVTPLAWLFGQRIVRRRPA